MSKQDENLFSGLEIMSPEETMATSIPSIEETPEETTTGETIENTETKDEGLTITTPVPGKTTETDEDRETTSTNVYAAFIKDMIKEDIILGPEEETELKELLKNANADTIKELMGKTVNKNVETKHDSWKKGLSSTQKRFLDIEDAFNDVDSGIQMAQRLEYLENLSTDRINEDISIQQNIYYEDLKLKGFTHEDALEAIEEAKSLNKLNEKSFKALASIKAHDNNIVATNKVKFEEQREQLKLDNETAYNTLMDNIDKKESFIDGLKLNKTIRDKIKNNIVDSVYKNDKGELFTSLMYKQMKNPSEFDMLINYYDTMGMFNLDKDGSFKPDISKLKAVAKTNAISELDNVLSTQGEVGQRTSVTASDQTSGLLDFLDRATGQKGRGKKRIK